ncbi:unnamed protein product [Parajaminaea phylloscopi]
MSTKPDLSPSPGPLQRRSAVSVSAAPARSAAPRSTRRLYVGNLHPSVSEYDLAQLFSPFGSLSRLELVFHQSGPLSGKPKGFAFVEFVRDEEALRAKLGTEGREWKGGRKLNIGFAASDDAAGRASATTSTGPVRRGRRDDDASRKPTTLSLVKNAQRPQGGTDGKIAAMEAKLLALKKTRTGAGAGSASGEGASTASPSLQRPPMSAGLPKKPPGSSTGTKNPPER